MNVFGERTPAPPRKRGNNFWLFFVTFVWGPLEIGAILVPLIKEDLHNQLHILLIFTILLDGLYTVWFFFACCLIATSLDYYLIIFVSVLQIIFRISLMAIIFGLGLVSEEVPGAVAYWVLTCIIHILSVFCACVSNPPHDGPWRHDLLKSRFHCSRTPRKRTTTV